MPSKEFTLTGGLAVTVYKRRANRNLRLSVSPSGQVRVSIPVWASYRTGLDFARSREAWILTQHKPLLPLKHGQAVGKSHHLRFAAKAGVAKAGGRVRSTEVVVYHPPAADPADPAVQAAAQAACIRALRSQGERLLPQRLANLAQTHGFQYSNVHIKALKSRWGSCDHRGRIVLNLFLMQLPWELIDYVLLHELTHTRILRHGPDFWQAMAEVSPDVQGLKKRLRDYQPVLIIG